MNFSVDKHNDASVLVLMECDTPHHKGMMIYPLPFLGENDDDDIVALIRKHYDPALDGVPPANFATYNVMFNMTPYSNAVAQGFMKRCMKSPTGLMILSCNENVQNYAIRAVQCIDFVFIEATDHIRDMFNTIEPLKQAKHIGILATRI